MDPIDLLIGLEGLPPNPFIIKPGRDTNDITTSYVPPAPKVDSRAIFVRNRGIAVEDTNDIDLPTLRDYEDRRTWHPDAQTRSPAVSDGRRFRILHGRSRNGIRGWGIPIGVRFENPSSVLVCARRMARRQSMFACGYYGKLGYRHSRRNSLSSISCW